MTARADLACVAQRPSGGVYHVDRLACAQEIDIANPKGNLRSAGFTVVGRPHPRPPPLPRLLNRPSGCPSGWIMRFDRGSLQEERQSFTDLYAESGWVDIFRRQASPARPTRTTPSTGVHRNPVRRQLVSFLFSCSWYGGS